MASPHSTTSSSSYSSSSDSEVSYDSYIEGSKAGDPSYDLRDISKIYDEVGYNRTLAEHLRLEREPPPPCALQHSWLTARPQRSSKHPPLPLSAF